MDKYAIESSLSPDISPFQLALMENNNYSIEETISQLFEECKKLQKLTEETATDNEELTRKVSELQNNVKECEKQKVLDIEAIVELADEVNKLYTEIKNLNSKAQKLEESEKKLKDKNKKNKKHLKRSYKRNQYPWHRSQRPKRVKRFKR